jgi:hypothetical protein
MLVTSFFQTGWLVDDIDQSIERWLALGNTGPFFVNRKFTLDEFLYRGRPIEMTLSSAFAQVGPMQIELIQQHSDSPSPFRDYDCGTGGAGFHHLGAFSDDYEADIARFAKRGVAPVGQGRLGDIRFAFVDTRPQLGAMLEFAHVPQSIISLFKMVADAAVGWDGTEPVRPFR